MALRLVQIAMNARDDSAVGRFWAEALGWGVDSQEPGVTNLEPAGFAYPDPAAVCIDVIAVPEPKTVKNRKGIGPYLEFLRTPDVKTMKNRVHLDLGPYPGDDQAAEVIRLRALGATDIDVGQGDVPWTCLADPEGNEFDVLTPR